MAQTQLVEPSTILNLPTGWDFVQRDTWLTRADFTNPALVPGTTHAVVESVDFYSLTLPGGVRAQIGGINALAAQTVEAQGSHVYATATIHHTEFNAGGVKVERYRYIIAHSQAQVLLALAPLIIPLLIAAIALYFLTNPRALQDLLTMIGNFWQVVVQTVEQPIINAYVFGVLAAGIFGVVTYFVATRHQGSSPPVKVPPPPLPKPAYAHAPEMSLGVDVKTPTGARIGKRTVPLPAGTASIRA